MFVARHCPSQTLVVVKQTNVDVQNAEQFENLKVCACFEVFTEQHIQQHNLYCISEIVFLKLSPLIFLKNKVYELFSGFSEVNLY